MHVKAIRGSRKTKEAELERIGSLSQTEARDIILAQTEENLTKNC